MSIQERLEGIKGVLAAGGEYIPPLLVILVGIASFGLGRLSALEDAKKPISIAIYEQSFSEPMRLGGGVVGSRTGKSYHFPWCPGAESIKETNQIWFKDEAAALARGYKPAGNCPGLE